MKKQIEEVVAFCSTAGQEINDHPAVVNKNEARKRLGYALSEVEELKTASKEENLEEELDAIVDIIYTLFGYAALKGIHKHIPDAWDRVHAKNMQKFSLSEIEANETIDRLKQSGVETSVEKKGVYFVVKDDNGKVMKPNGWTPPVHNI